MPQVVTQLSRDKNYKSYQLGGNIALQLGHSSFTSIHSVKHYSWNLWLQGVFIIETSFWKGYSNYKRLEFITLEFLSLGAYSNKFYKQIEHSISLFVSSLFILIL